MLDFRYLLGSLLASVAFALGALWMLSAHELAQRPSLQTAAAPREAALHPQASGPVIIEVPDRPPPEMPPVAPDEPEITGSIPPPSVVPLPLPRPEQEAKEEPRPRRIRPRVAQEPKQPEVLNPFQLFFPGVARDRPANALNRNLN